MIVHASDYRSYCICIMIIIILVVAAATVVVVVVVVVVVFPPSTFKSVRGHSVIVFDVHD
jgi:hypothetical protein